MAPRREVFVDNVKEIMTYIDEGVDRVLRLPRQNKRAQYLAKWLHRQSNRKNVPDDEKEILDMLEQFRERKKGWDYFYRWLIVYKEDHHHLLISTKDTTNRQLYDWTERQRRDAKDDRLLPERRKALEDIGFSFSPKQQETQTTSRFTKKQEVLWEERYKELIKYKDEHGHCNVSFINDQCQRILAIWVSTQRDTHSKGKMDETRKQKLNNIGFVWKC